MTLLQAVSGPSLSTAMREGSRAEHTAAETSGFMTELLEGNINEQGYADYLLRLRAVYAALEETAHDLREDPAVAAVRAPELDRLAAIDRDLDHWVGPAPRTVESPAVEAYCRRIVAARDWAPLFVAHHYTRYLGDLSGGQAIGRILERTFGLDGAGVAFYAFPGIPKPKPFKDAYRARLDELGATLDDAGRNRVVAEVRAAFALNQALFDELGRNLERYRRLA